MKKRDNRKKQQQVKGILSNLKAAIKGQEQDYTKISIRKGIFFLAVPMILEMVMESLFAVVDIFFVGRLGAHAIATVGLTESVITIVYSIGIGISMAATAMISRRFGEKNYKDAGSAAFQLLVIGGSFSLLMGVLGWHYAGHILQLMGGDAMVVAEGAVYTKVIFAGNMAIMLLFLINGAFRGAGLPHLAMRTLWISNGINIFLDPLMIFGIGNIPGMGLEGAAWATTIGRSIGVAYQLYHLCNGHHLLKITKENLKLRWKVVKRIISISTGGMGQFLIDSASWIILTRLMAEFGSVALAGHTIAFRIVMFTLMPAWGLSSAAATLVGQNLGANKAKRAEVSVWTTARYNMYFLAGITLVYLVAGQFFVSLFSPEEEVIKIASTALRIISLGYVFYAVGMVMVQAFNGAGDTRTPALINIIVISLMQIPLAYLLSIYAGLGPMGVFITIAFSHSLHGVVALWLFKKGRWKTVKV